MDHLYIEPVTEEEIIQLVNNAKNKTSKGHNGLDMCLVKKIIPYHGPIPCHVCYSLDSIFWKHLRKLSILNDIHILVYYLQ